MLGLLLARRGWVRPTGREWALLVVCGVGWFGIYNLALNAAEQHLDAGTTAMLVNIGPILIAVFAGLLLGEGFPRWLLAGIAVAFVGVLLIGVATRERARPTWWASSSASSRRSRTPAGVVAQKPLLRRLPGLQVTATACAMGAVCCLPWAGTLVGELGAAPAGSIAGMVYLGAVPTALAFSTWAYALAPDGRRQARRHHLRRPAAGDPARLAAARRGAAARSRWWAARSAWPASASPAVARRVRPPVPVPQEASPTV